MKINIDYYKAVNKGHEATSEYVRASTRDFLEAFAKECFRQLEEQLAVEHEQKICDCEERKVLEKYGYLRIDMGGRWRHRQPYRTDWETVNECPCCHKPLPRGRLDREGKR